MPYSISKANYKSISHFPCSYQAFCQHFHIAVAIAMFLIRFHSAACRVVIAAIHYRRRSFGHVAWRSISSDLHLNLVTLRKTISVFILNIHDLTLNQVAFILNYRSDLISQFALLYRPGKYQIPVQLCCYWTRKDRRFTLHNLSPIYLFPMRPFWCL